MKHRKHNKRNAKTANWSLIVLTAVLLLILAVVIVRQVSKPENKNHQAETNQSQTTSDPSANTEPTSVETLGPALELPYSLEFGKLTIDAAFLLNGMNPDCGNTWGENVAAIQITNTSLEHLASVTFFVITTDGTVIEFAANDIPCGATSMLFALDNRSMQGQIACMEIVCEAVFEAKTPLMEDMVAITVEGNAITIKNLTDKDLSQLTVYCHDRLDDICYGGLTYQYTVPVLPAGESVTLIAEDCIMGQPEVVRITIND